MIQSLQQQNAVAPSGVVQAGAERVSLRVTGQFTSEESLRAVVKAAHSAGKAAGILVRDLSGISHHLQLGFTWVAVESDVAILRKAYQLILSSK